MPNPPPSTNHPTTTTNNQSPTTNRPDIVRRLGDLGAITQQAFIDRLTANPAARAAIEQHMAALRTELAGPHPTPLENLLVERVVACWLQVHHADLTFAAPRDNLSFDQRDYYSRRQNRAHARYLAAIRSLAQVRRLLQPTIQLNVAEQQINIVKD